MQSLDPIGVGARDLRECLLLQLEFLEVDAPLVEIIVRDHWDEFMQRKFVPLAKTLGIDMKTLEGHRRDHQAPRSEARAGSTPTSARSTSSPTSTSTRSATSTSSSSTKTACPSCASTAATGPCSTRWTRSPDGETVNYIKDKIRSAVWLIKSLDQRQRTIYKVAESIVKHQREFLEKGIDYLRPLVLRDVADDIQMHESTVSRVVSNKYMHTPRGLFLMKYFFHSGIDSDTGEDISSLTVKKKIQSFIENEDPRKPSRDSKIMKILNDEGINIARRTVAKYRDELNIPSSTDRKQIF